MKFYLLWSLMLLLKLLLAWQLQLFGDEAFYAWEATKPAWAYSDLPGMTAWLIRLGLELGAYHPFAIRLSFVLIGAVIPFLVVRIARHFSSENHAWQAGLLSCCLPLLLPIGFMALPEAPLCLAALLCLDAALCLLKEKADSIACLELALGLFIGASTHYRFVIILLAGGLGFVLAGGWRQYRNPKLLFAIAIGAISWLPLFLYNLQNDNAGWQFQFHERNPWAFSTDGFTHLPIQAIVTTPVLYGALLWCLWPVFKSWRQAEKKMGLVLVAAGLPLITFAGLAFFADQIRTSLHWPFQAYFPLVAVLPFLISVNFPRWHKKMFHCVLLSGLLGVTLVCCYFLTILVPGLTGALAGKKYYPDNFVGWNEVSESTKSLLREDEILVADNFMLAAQLQFSFAGTKQIYVLDHPLNKKHGRARQLQAWQVDSGALMSLKEDTPVFIVIEESNTKEWLRDQWRARLCTQFNNLKFESLVYGPGKGKSFSIFRARLGADPAVPCDSQILQQKPVGVPTSAKSLQL